MKPIESRLLYTSVGHLILFPALDSGFVQELCGASGALLASTLKGAKWNDECLPSDNSCLEFSIKDGQFEGGCMAH